MQAGKNTKRQKRDSTKILVTHILIHLELF